MDKPDSKAPGKTLWEMLVQRVRGDGNGAAIPFYNPLNLGINSALPVPFANGAEFADYEFSVKEIREYTRQIRGQRFVFTDYVLRGVNRKTFDTNDELTARVRAVPNDAGTHDSLLLCVYDEFAFAEDFLGVLKDDTGRLEMTDDENHRADEFTRINDVRDSYEAAVMVITGTGPDLKGTPGSVTSLKLEYWDYWRDADIGQGNTGKEFVFVEMNAGTGWFQIWRGKEFFQ